YVFSDRSKIPPLQFKSGWWMLLWIGGLAVLSYLGNYGEGSLGVLTFAWGELACLIVTAIVFAVGVGTRLKSDEVIANVENTTQSSAEISVGAGDCGRSQQGQEPRRCRDRRPRAAGRDG